MHAGNDAVLVFASEYGHVDVVQLLIQHGDSAHAGNDEWVWAALQAALKNGHSDVARLLIQHSAQVARRSRPSGAG